jgi:hypothetical protein
MSGFTGAGTVHDFFLALIFMNISNNFKLNTGR